MKLLLDTHVCLWFLSDDHRLPAFFREVIEDRESEVYLSVVSLWEAVIKHQLGKLPLPAEPAEYLTRERLANDIDTLPIVEGAMSHLANLPPIHRDPFDRLLVAQALQHGLTLVTADPLVAAYEVDTLKEG